MRVLPVLLAASFTLTCVGSPPVPCTECSGKCVDTNTDSKNCGGCGKACIAGNLCSEGACVAACAAGQQACSTGCSNLQLDRNNCGVCGKVCPAGQVCSAGTCAASCGSGYSTCTVGGEDVCVDLANDARNCGMCNLACASGQVCQAMQCTVSCPAGRTMCNPGGVPPYCTDTATDNANCGGCAQPCQQGAACNAGVCDAICSAPLVSCSADAGATPHYCANTQNDARNCGACGKACAAQELCSGGTCHSVYARSCAELQASLGGTGSDGPATLYLEGKSWFPFKATCADMDGGATVVTVTVQTVKDDAGNNTYLNGNLVYYNDSGVVLQGNEPGPKTYLDLQQTGANQNFSQYNNVGFPPSLPPFLTDRWTKVRFDPASLQVAIDDFRFVTTAGYGGNQSPAGLTYGTGGACNGFARGNANIDVRSTPFLVDPGNTWAANFSCCTGMGGSVTFSSNNQVVDVQGGGSCGEFDLYTNALGPSRLQLRHRPFSCDTIKKANPAATDGVYSLFDGTALDAGAGRAPLAYCDMTAGGFTLVMKIDGTNASSRFFYDDPLWTNEQTYNAALPDLARTEAKYPTFMSVPFNELRFVTYDGATQRTLGVPAPAQRSLHAALSSGTFSALAAGGPPAWTAAFGGGTLEPRICTEGFNAFSLVAKVRIGVIDNNENDCLTPDSYSGVGGQIPPGNGAPGRPTFKGWAAGSFGCPGCGGAPGSADKGVFTYLYVR